MKYDPDKWQEVPHGKKIVVPAGQVQLRLSRPCAVYSETEGVETLVGYDAAFDLKTGAEMTIYADPLDPQVRMFAWWPTTLVLEDLTSPVFTNIDRQADDSPHLDFVKGGLRALEFAKREMLREVRAVTAGLSERMMKRKGEETEPDPELEEDEQDDDDDKRKDEQR